MHTGFIRFLKILSLLILAFAFIGGFVLGNTFAFIEGGGYLRRTIFNDGVMLYTWLAGAVVSFGIYIVHCLLNLLNAILTKLDDKGIKESVAETNQTAEPEPSPLLPPPAFAENMITCPACGLSQSNERMKCWNCSKPLRQEVDQTPD